jgi:putative membrane protein
MDNLLSNALVSSVVYSVLGIIVWLAGYYVIEKLTPEDTWGEIVKNKNTAIAIIFGSMIIAIALIISAAIHG